MENYYKLMELEAGDFGLLEKERSIFLAKMPRSYPESTNYQIDGRFESNYELKDWYRSAIRKWQKGYRVTLTYGEIVAIRSVILSCDVKLPKDIKDLFCGMTLYFHVLKASDRFVSTILSLLSNVEIGDLVKHYKQRAVDFEEYAKKNGRKL